MMMNKDLYTYEYAHNNLKNYIKKKEKYGSRAAIKMTYIQGILGAN